MSELYQERFVVCPGLAQNSRKPELAMGTKHHHATEDRLHHAGALRRSATSREISGLPEMEPPARLFTIREMAQEFQVTTRALRFYEDRGMLRPKRDGSVRRYNDRDRLHLKMILKGKRLGFTLAEIHAILAGSGEEYGKTELEMELTAGQIAAQISHLEHQRDQIQTAIATLRQAQQRLIATAKPKPF